MEAKLILEPCLLIHIGQGHCSEKSYFLPVLKVPPSLVFGAIPLRVQEDTIGTDRTPLNSGQDPAVQASALHELATGGRPMWAVPPGHFQRSHHLTSSLMTPPDTQPCSLSNLRLGSQCPGAMHPEQPLKAATAPLLEPRVLVLSPPIPARLPCSLDPPQAPRPFPSLSVLCYYFPEYGGSLAEPGIRIPSTACHTHVAGLAPISDSPGVEWGPGRHTSDKLQMVLIQGTQFEHQCPSECQQMQDIRYVIKEKTFLRGRGE